MILHGQLCGNVGRRRDYFREGPVLWNGAFFFLRENFREGAAMELNLGCGHLGLLDKYYLKHTLQSEPARSTWVAPDLAPLSCCLDSARFST